ncbi:hypothetical protein TNCV_2551071 [Trichonephila clavipes]|nr:hypothetical protein TNCV_2551071 [Trichonephila clavipes]
MEQNPTWVFNILTDYFKTTITVPKPRNFLFETQCPVNGWITNAQRYLTLLRETVVPCLIQRGQIAICRMEQPVTLNPVKAFLRRSGKTESLRRCRYPWPPRSPDLTPTDYI